jgi:predicted permease
MDLIKLALAAALIGGALLLSLRRPEPLRVLARVLVGVALGLEIALALTGFGRDRDSPVGQAHHVLGGVIVTVALFAAGMSLAVSVSRWRYQLIRTIGRVVLAGFAFLVCLSTSFTGYLKPTDPVAQPDTYLRFRVLHMGFQPLILAMLLVAWWFELRPVIAKEPA